MGNDVYRPSKMTTGFSRMKAFGDLDKNSVFRVMGRKGHESLTVVGLKDNKWRGNQRQGV